MDSFNDRHLLHVKKMAQAAVSRDVGSVDGSYLQVQDYYIVWFNYTLGNYKALLSSDKLDGIYVEVTYNIANSETYVDIYHKFSNQRFTKEKISYNPLSL